MGALDKYEFDTPSEEGLKESNHKMRLRFSALKTAEEKKKEAGGCGLGHTTANIATDFLNYQECEPSGESFPY